MWAIKGKRQLGQRTGDSPLPERLHGQGNGATLTSKDFAIIFKNILHAQKDIACFHINVRSADLQDTGKQFAQGNLSKRSPK